jgi:hypothetical protein
MRSVGLSAKNPQQRLFVPSMPTKESTPEANHSSLSMCHLQYPVTDRAGQQLPQVAAGPPALDTGAAGRIRFAHDFSLTPIVQRKRRQEGAASLHDLEQESTAAPQRPPHGTDPTGMPARLRAKMEDVMGADFSDVRVQTGSDRAVQLRALAFAQGNEIHIAPGHWAPETTQGQALLGHELGHVLQQRAGRVAASSNLGTARLNHDPALEQEADALGERAAYSQSGRSDVTGVAANRKPILALSPHTNVIQRQPLPPPAPGSATEQVLQALETVSPIAGVGDFPAAFRILDGLTVVDLLATLTDLERRLQLDLLIANAGSAAPFHQTRLVTAMQVVRQSHGPGTDLRAAHATVAAAGLPAAEQQAMTNYLLAQRPALPAARGADQRAAIAPGGAAALPNADLARELGYELDPSSRPAPAPPVPVAPGVPPPPPPPPPPRIPWDGRAGAPGEAAARTAMQAELFAAFDAYLTFKRAATVAALARPRVSFTTPAAAPGAAGPAPTGVVDIANQARTVLETRYATSMDAAATTPAQLSARSPRQASGAGQNIFDASSEADRSTLTSTPDLARGVAWWLFENDVPGAAGAPGSRRFATEILAAHHYSAQDDPNGQFRWAVDQAYANAVTLAPNNRRQLIDYRMADWSERGTQGITLLSAFDPGADRNRAELVQRWNIFKTATHESLHLRAHPAFVAAEQGRGTMAEGFVEMFTVATLNTDVLPRTRAGGMEPLRRTVEGSLSPAAPDATLITDRVTPTQYVAHRAQAERIRDGGTPTGGVAHTGIGEAGVRAAFFQGHVEYLGLAPTGAQLTTLPAAGATPLTRIPGGISGLNDLAQRSGVPRPTIERDNPGITDALPPTAVLAGCREHWVVTGETRAQIALQNGVSEADLVRANPDIPLGVVNEWPALTAGQRILIPVH